MKWISMVKKKLLIQTIIAEEDLYLIWALILFLQKPQVYLMEKTINYLILFQNFSRQKKISLARKPIKKDYSKYHNVVYHSATAIPIATAVAQSFNVDLAQKYGDIIGKEMELFNIQLLLAPGMNIHRNILCGRNFEYYSEDPLVTGKMAAAITRGVQSHKHKGTTLKHFAANNQ